MEQLTTKIVHFDSAVFSIETIKKAAYRYLDRFAPTIEATGGAIVCHLSFPKGTDADAVDDAVAEFKKEVLDQDLRQLVAGETVAFRNAILALAFSSSNLTKG